MARRASPARSTSASQRDAADDDERALQSGRCSDVCVTPPKAAVVDLDDERLRIRPAVRLPSRRRVRNRLSAAAAAATPARAGDEAVECMRRQ
jgi:hypothetical protein